MVQLSPNAVQLPSKGLSCLAAVPEVAHVAFAAHNLGSTTHRDNHHSAPSSRRPGSGSGAMTARGKPLPSLVSLQVPHATA